MSVRQLCDVEGDETSGNKGMKLKEVEVRNKKRGGGGEAEGVLV